MVDGAASNETQVLLYGYMCAVTPSCAALAVSVWSVIAWGQLTGSRQLGAATAPYAVRYTAAVGVLLLRATPCAITGVAPSTGLPLFAVKAVELLKSTTLEAEPERPRGASYMNSSSLHGDIARPR